MFGSFRKKKAYLIKWERNAYVLHEIHETVVRANCKADVNWKFLQGHNAELEKIKILDIKEVSCIWIILQPFPKIAIMREIHMGDLEWKTKGQKCSFFLQKKKY